MTRLWIYRSIRNDERKYKMKPSKVVLSVVVMMACCLTGCKNEKEGARSITPSEVRSVPETEQVKKPTIELATSEPEVTSIEENIEKEEQEQPSIQIMDVGDVFGDYTGCAVIYENEGHNYQVYHEEMAREQVSPYSTFKIVSTLVGLKNGILVDEDTKMEYNQKKYGIEAWNHDLTLSEAFQFSCVWYFRQMIDRVGQEQMEKELIELHYGNHDVSEWEGENHKEDAADIDGFWLRSSLKISPMEQVEVLKKIFEGKSQFSNEEVDLLKKIMLTDECEIGKILGKTGTGMDEGWYVGILQDTKIRKYFAVYIEGESKGMKACGAEARKIVVKLMDRK